jgi:hypothetical protein
MYLFTIVSIFPFILNSYEPPKNNGAIILWIINPIIRKFIAWLLIVLLNSGGFLQYLTKSILLVIYIVNREIVPIIINKGNPVE